VHQLQAPITRRGGASSSHGSSIRRPREQIRCPEGADSSAAGVPTSPPTARHGDGWGPAAIGGVEAGTGEAISLAARASCCGLKQRDAMAGSGQAAASHRREEGPPHY
jgi:hypothetical protein